MKTYYAEDFREDMLELSDNRIEWDIANYAEGKPINEVHYDYLINEMVMLFKDHYKGNYPYLCGRSCRHVCVKDTPYNRRNYRYMVNVVDKMQWLIVYILTKNEIAWTNHLQIMPKWLADATKHLL